MQPVKKNMGQGILILNPEEIARMLLSEVRMSSCVSDKLFPHKPKLIIGTFKM